ncbi:MAG: shikimate kinase [Verrucomicrobiales bacterium]|jgi:shikimate kinase
MLLVLMKDNRPASKDRCQNIVLIGFMGTGKTTIGKIASERLGLAFVDTDDLIVEREGQPIPQIFERVGEAGFRKIETDVLRGLAGEGGKIIATGGGIITQPENIRLLQELGFVVWLAATVETIFERVSMNRDRPLLYTEDPLQTITDLLAEREAQYEAASDLRVETDNFHADEITHGIAASAEHFFSGGDA